MSLLWRYLGHGLVVASMLVMGCGDHAETNLAPQDVPDGGVDGSISFDDQETLLLAPSEIVDIGVITSPPAAYSVSFYLAGNALDASLDQSQVVTHSSTGKASVKLRAPNSATNFVVRATIKDGPAADLSVSVSDQGFGTLQITPTYGGNRSVEEWLGRVVSGTTCEALAEDFPEDPEGALIGSAAADEPVVITGAPVGPNLTVFVRAGHYMWGCTDETHLVAGETAAVEVSIVNKPIVLDQAYLDIELEFAPEPEPWLAIIEDGKALMMSSFFGGTTSTAQLLLDTMSGLAGNQNDFDLAASTNDWMTAIDAHLTTHSIDLQQTLSDLADSGMAQQPKLIAGKVDAFEQAPGHALFTLTRIGTVNAAQTGVPAEYVTTLTVDPDDTVHLGGSLFWLPTRHIGVVTEQEGMTQDPQAVDFEHVLAEIMKCDSLTLTGYGGCEGLCIAQLCRTALATRWNVALDGSASTYQWGEVPFGASGEAQFDDVAALFGFEGSWLGQVTSGLLNASVTGAVIAETPESPAAD